jgi:hypothetical protein
VANASQESGLIFVVVAQCALKQKDNLVAQRAVVGFRLLSQPFMKRFGDVADGSVTMSLL